MTIKKELSLYYVTQGLTGKHLRGAIRSDMRSLRKQGVNTNAGTRRGFIHGHLVCCGKSWEDLREGSMYWSKRSLNYHGPM